MHDSFQDGRDGMCFLRLRGVKCILTSARHLWSPCLCTCEPSDLDWWQGLHWPAGVCPFTGTLGWTSLCGSRIVLTWVTSKDYVHSPWSYHNNLCFLWRTRLLPSPDVREATRCWRRATRAPRCVVESSALPAGRRRAFPPAAALLLRRRVGAAVNKSSWR
jgi:hypothetical protein